MHDQRHQERLRLLLESFQKTSIFGAPEAIPRLSQEIVDDWQVGEERDLAQEMTDGMLRLTAGVLLGVEQLEFAADVGRLIERWRRLTNDLGLPPYLSEPALTDRYDELLSVAEELEAAMHELIRLRRTAPLGNDVLSLLIQASEHGDTISDVELIAHLVLMFGAAHPASAHILTWTIVLLAQHPDVLARLHQEFDNELPDRSPGLDDLDGLTYLDTVLKESMRVLPACAYSQRVAAQAVELGPFRLSPGSVVIFSPFITHHLPSCTRTPNDSCPPAGTIKVPQSTPICRWERVRKCVGERHSACAGSSSRWSRLSGDIGSRSSQIRVWMRA